MRGPARHGGRSAAPPHSTPEALPQIGPSTISLCSEIIACFQTGSQTMSTSASSTPGTYMSLDSEYRIFCQPPRGLTQPGRRVNLAPVDPVSIKVVGQLHKTPWQRFARLQRTAARLAQGRGQPKGVFRFASNEECDKWTANLNRNAK